MFAVMSCSPELSPLLRPSLIFAWHLLPSGEFQNWSIVKDAGVRRLGACACRPLRTRNLTSRTASTAPSTQLICFLFRALACKLEGLVQGIEPTAWKVVNSDGVVSPKKLLKGERWPMLTSACPLSAAQAPKTVVAVLYTRANRPLSEPSASYEFPCAVFAGHCCEHCKASPEIDGA